MSLSARFAQIKPVVSECSEDECDDGDHQVLARLLGKNRLKPSEPQVDDLQGAHRNDVHLEDVGDGDALSNEDEESGDDEEESKWREEFQAVFSRKKEDESIVPARTCLRINTDASIASNVEQEVDEVKDDEDFNPPLGRSEKPNFTKVLHDEDYSLENTPDDSESSALETESVESPHKENMFAVIKPQVLEDMSCSDVKGEEKYSSERRESEIKKLKDKMEILNAEIELDKWGGGQINEISTENKAIQNPKLETSTDDSKQKPIILKSLPPSKNAINNTKKDTISQDNAIANKSKQNSNDEKGNVSGKNNATGQSDKITRHDSENQRNVSRAKPIEAKKSKCYNILPAKSCPLDELLPAKPEPEKTKKFSNTAAGHKQPAEVAIDDMPPVNIQYGGYSDSSVPNTSSFWAQGPGQPDVFHGTVYGSSYQTETNLAIGSSSNFGFEKNSFEDTRLSSTNIYDQDNFSPQPMSQGSSYSNSPCNSENQNEIPVNGEGDGNTKLDENSRQLINMVAAMEYGNKLAIEKIQGALIQQINQTNKQDVKNYFSSVSGTGDGSHSSKNECEKLYNLFVQQCSAIVKTEEDKGRLKSLLETVKEQTGDALSGTGFTPPDAHTFDTNSINDVAKPVDNDDAPSPYSDIASACTGLEKFEGRTLLKGGVKPRHIPKTTLKSSDKLRDPRKLKEGKSVNLKLPKYMTKLWGEEVVRKVLDHDWNSNSVKRPEMPYNEKDPRCRKIVEEFGAQIKFNTNVSKSGEEGIPNEEHRDSTTVKTTIQDKVKESIHGSVKINTERNSILHGIINSFEEMQKRANFTQTVDCTKSKPCIGIVKPIQMKKKSIVESVFDSSKDIVTNTGKQSVSEDTYMDEGQVMSSQESVESKEHAMKTTKPFYEDINLHKKMLIRNEQLNVCRISDTTDSPDTEGEYYDVIDSEDDRDVDKENIKKSSEKMNKFDITNRLDSEGKYYDVIDSDDDPDADIGDIKRRSEKMEKFYTGEKNKAKKNITEKSEFKQNTLKEANGEKQRNSSESSRQSRNWVKQNKQTKSKHDTYLAYQKKRTRSRSRSVERSSRRSFIQRERSSSFSSSDSDAIWSRADRFQSTNRDRPRPEKHAEKNGRNESRPEGKEAQYYHGSRRDNQYYKLHSNRRQGRKSEDREIRQKQSQFHSAYNEYEGQSPVEREVMKIYCEKMEKIERMRTPSPIFHDHRASATGLRRSPSQLLNDYRVNRIGYTGLDRPSSPLLVDNKVDRVDNTGLDYNQEFVRETHISYRLGDYSRDSFWYRSDTNREKIDRFDKRNTAVVDRVKETNNAVLDRFSEPNTTVVDRLAETNTSADRFTKTNTAALDRFFETNTAAATAMMSRKRHHTISEDNGYGKISRVEHVAKRRYSHEDARQKITGNMIDAREKLSKRKSKDRQYKDKKTDTLLDSDARFKIKRNVNPTAASDRMEVVKTDRSTHRDVPLNSFLTKSRTFVHYSAPQRSQGQVWSENEPRIHVSLSDEDISREFQDKFGIKRKKMEDTDENQNNITRQNKTRHTENKPPNPSLGKIESGFPKQRHSLQRMRSQNEDDRKFLDELKHKISDSKSDTKTSPEAALGSTLGTGGCEMASRSSSGKVRGQSTSEDVRGVLSYGDMLHLADLEDSGTI